MLISVQDVKDFLGIASTVTVDDDKIMPLCQAAQDEAEGGANCGYKLEGSTYVELLDGDGTDIIKLRNVPIKSVTSIHDDVDRVYGSDTLVSADDYCVDVNTGLILADGFLWTKGRRNIRAEYLAGYNPIGSQSYTNLPYNLKIALVQLAVAMYLEGKAGVQVFENQEIVYRPSYLRKEAQKVFAQYRRLDL